MRIVLVGAGHAHLYTLKHAGELTGRGHEVVLVNPSRYLDYSGMATGVLSGRYRPDEARINAAALVERGGGGFVDGAVAGISPAGKTLRLASGASLDYDLVSFATGSSTSLPDALKPADGNLFPVKPVGNLVRLRRRLLGGSGFRGGRILVVGGGAAGCEVAANLAALHASQGARAGRIALVETARRLLPSAPERASRLMRRHLEGAGVEVVIGSQAAGGGPEAGTVVAATGVRAPELFARSGLSSGAGGGLLVDQHLRSVDNANVFGGGDSVSVGRKGLPGFGVYAIRQGPVLFENLAAAADGGALRRFRPQKRNLYIMNLGDGTGLGVYGGLVWKGRSARLAKDYIDLRFIRDYRV
ncbi:NAD(P)/FAD-dependent oxidoreductase [Rubrobacter indicoceani]|uniref:NAD(P)/FAD-dependent oxidoreductase n=1 Tax=Rubrobacter indicoceani TaxID=2051957 RepID=UPI000E5BAF14|nr:FAD-dependent oxidoreductase [Rubrobacter indicoceani]